MANSPRRERYFSEYKCTCHRDSQDSLEYCLTCHTRSPFFTPRLVSMLDSTYL